MITSYMILLKCADNKNNKAKDTLAPKRLLNSIWLLCHTYFFEVGSQTFRNDYKIWRL